MATIDTILGAALVLGAQLFMHSVTRTTGRQDLRRERIEAIAKSIFEHSLWLERDRSRKVFGIPNEDIKDHFSDACVVQELYVMELRSEMHEYRKAVQKHYVVISEYFDEIKREIPGETIMDAKRRAWSDKKYLDDFYGPYLDARGALIKKCRALIEADEAPLVHRWYNNLSTLLRRQA